jgi:hypothetical protein
MKAPSFALALLALLIAPLGAAISPIRMDIEQHSATKQPQSKGGKPSNGPKTQTRSLTIKLANNSADSFDRLLVKYWFLGHDMKGHDITVLQQGDRKSSLEPRAREIVDSEVVTSVYTDAHVEVSKGKSKGGKGRSSAKKVPASGKKITGYAVQVLNGGKVEAEYYSEPSYKQIVQASAPSISEVPKKKAPAKKPAAKKKK